jgi:transposase
MDNCSIHKNQRIEVLIDNAGHELIFIPPYSPQLNSIENCFAKWKNVIKPRKANTNVELNN